jgi:hypothetical protein
MTPLFEALGSVLVGILLITIGLLPRVLERVADALGDLAALWMPWISKPRDMRIQFRQSRWLIVLGAAYIVAAATAFYSR